MSMDDEAEQTGAFGRAPSQWEQALIEALDDRDNAAVRAALHALRAELSAQAEQIQRLEDAPGLDRLMDQARRLLRAGPTDTEILEREQDAERRLWSGYRDRYRQIFVPEPLHPFLGSCGLFLRPVTDLGAQYTGFDKYAASSRTEAVTLFQGRGDGIPPNFFSSFDPRDGTLVVQRAYRTQLPRGAGATVIAEHVEQLVPDPADLRALVFENVQNSATYAAHVDTSGEWPRLRDGIGPGDSALGRLGGRVLALRGQLPTAVRPTLDTFGFLDLRLVVGRGSSAVD